MTDEKLMKILKCCANDDCSNCPTQVKQCRQHAMLNALDLINRQKAEIARLQCEIKEKTETIVFLKDQAVGWSIDFCNIKNKVKTAKTEAIKEFAERLKRNLDISVCGYSSEEVTSSVEDTIDNLVKEMTEDAK